MKKKYIFSAVMLAMAMTVTAQTTITFDTDDYGTIGVYDQWSESPFRTGALAGNAAVADNPDKEVDAVLGTAPNASDKVVALQRSRFAGNAFGVRIDLKTPIRVTKTLQYIHVMAYLKDKPESSRMMVIGLGKRIEEAWNWQTGEEEQFYALTNAPVQPNAGWQDVVVSFKGFSYAEDDTENAGKGIDIHSLVIVPDVRSPHADESDWVAYFDQIVVDDNPDKRFSTDKYALNFDKDAKHTRGDRNVNGVGLTVDGKAQTVTCQDKVMYTDGVTLDAFSAKAGQQVQPTFNYKGGWMNAYVYVDWGCDGVFSYDVNDDGTPADGSDVVSYNAAQVNGAWRKSDGTTVTNGNNIAAGVPAFTVPAGTENGFYRMRYKVDWDNLDPAGASAIISNAGGIVDVVLDVHGDAVSVNASQLNGDILLAADNSALQNHQAAYGQPLKVKIVPENGFVQNGFALKYGYNVNAAEQLDENGNPNWILVNVPATAMDAENTYTIPAECMRGSHVSIVGDMQQAQHYSVRIEGAPAGQGGVVYTGITYADGETIDASQYFSAEDVTAVELEGYIVAKELDPDTKVLTVTYTKVLPYIEVTSLSELHNDKAYHIKAASGEGYLAWNSVITNNYVSLRGVTVSTQNGLPSNKGVANIYQEEVDPFDATVVWQILKEGGSYYLYQPANKLYVTRTDRDYVFTAEKTALDKIRDNGDGTFSFHAGGNYSDGSTYFACICTNQNPEAVRNWTYDDHGSKMYIIENPNVEVSDITTPVQDVITGGVAVAPRGIYNLQGQRLNAMPKEGIVIVDGKKRTISAF